MRREDTAQLQVVLFVRVDVHERAEASNTADVDAGLLQQLVHAGGAFLAVHVVSFLSLFGWWNGLARTCSTNRSSLTVCTRGKR